MSRPGRALPTSDEDPYQALVVAILQRAVLDARGHTFPCGAVPPECIQAAAQAWLAAEEDLAELLDLAGFNSTVVLAALRKQGH